MNRLQDHRRQAGSNLASGFFALRTRPACLRKKRRNLERALAAARAKDSLYCSATKATLRSSGSHGDVGSTRRPRDRRGDASPATQRCDPRTEAGAKAGAHRARGGARATASVARRKRTDPSQSSRGLYIRWHGAYAKSISRRLALQGLEPGPKSPRSGDGHTIARSEPRLLCCGGGQAAKDAGLRANAHGLPPVRRAALRKEHP